MRKQSVHTFIVSLASISALLSASALPVPSESITLAPRNNVKVDIGGKVAELGKQLSHADHSKATVHQLTKWDGKSNPGAVIKTYSAFGHNVGSKEIEGLKAAGQYIHHDGKHVVMKEIKGRPLADLVADVPRKNGQRKEYIDKMKDTVAAHAAHMAETKGILHGDLNLNNVMVHKGNIQLVDWEHHVKKGEPGFTHDKEKIKHHVDLWDSDQTPPQGRKKKSLPQRLKGHLATAFGKLKAAFRPKSSHQSGSPSHRSGSPSHKAGKVGAHSHNSGSHKRRDLMSQI